MRDTLTVIFFRRSASLALILAILGLAACGQTGGLYQPPPETDSASRAAATDA